MCAPAQLPIVYPPNLNWPSIQKLRGEKVLLSHNSVSESPRNLYFCAVADTLRSWFESWAISSNTNFQLSARSLPAVSLVLRPS